MNLATVCGWAFVLFTTWYVVSAFRSWYRLRQVPGPLLASFSYLWLAQSHVRGRIGTAHVGLKKYGSLVRNGPNYLVTDDPEVLRRLSVARSRYGKDLWYRGGKFHPDQDTMLTILDNAGHDRLKAKTSAGYGGREGIDLAAVIDAQILRLLDLIRRKYLSTRETLQAVDVSFMTRYFSLDVVGHLAFGEPFGHLDEGEDIYGYCKDVDRAIDIISFTFDLPLVRRILFSPLMLRLIAPKPTDPKGVGRLMRVFEENIARRFTEDAKPRPDDMIASFIKNGLTQQECESEAVLLVVAGSDSTATAIRVALMYLSATPRAYGRLKAEIRGCLDRKEASFPITLEETKKLPYLRAVVWESFRMRCPSTYGFYKSVPPEGDTINGLFIPGGTAIGLNTLALTRKESIFGQDVDVFRPERFLECTESKKLEMERALEIVFGGGRWMCAGKQIALMELHKVIFELLKAFDFQFVRPEKAWEENWNTTVCHTNVWMRISEADG